MKILDIRGNLVKIESDRTLPVSALLKITDGINEYLAQVLYIERVNFTNTLFAKLIANYSTPFEAIEIGEISKQAVCEPISFEKVFEKFNDKPEIILGELTYENFTPVASRKFFDKKLLIVSENQKHTDTIINNFAHQLKNIGQKTLIFDIDGTTDGVKLTAGLDFKIPLNAHAINFIYEKYFADITDASKALVTDIFKELSEYAKTVPYIPFKTFKNAIDEVFDYSKNLSLYFFKTKLEQLAKAEIFANSNDDIMDWASLSELDGITLSIDLSKINRVFVSEYVNLIVNSFNNSEEKLYAFLKLEESFTDKDFLKELIENEKVITSFITHSNFKFMPALKQNCGSFIVLGGVKKPDNFDYCKFLLKNLSPDKYVVIGEYTDPIALIFQVKEITDVLPQETKENEEEIIEKTTIATEFENNLLAENNSETEPENVYEPIEEPINDDTEIISSPIEDYNPLSISEEISLDDEISIEPVENEASEATSEEPTENENNIISENIELEEISLDDNIIIEDTMTDYIEDADENIITEEIPDYNPDAVTEENANPFEENVIEEIPEQSVLDIEEEQSETLEELNEQESLDLALSEELDIIETDTQGIVEEPTNNDNELEEEITLQFTDENESFALEEEPLEQIQEEPLKTEEELLDEQIRRDVDRVYMAQPEPDNETLSEDDLDFIEELVGGEDLIIEELPEVNDEEIEVLDEELELDNSFEEEPQEEFKNEQIPSGIPDEVLTPQSTPAPSVPIYAAEIPEEAIVQSDPIQQGDRVIHVKFGIGVVEKIFSYGTKNFCSINFENIGRKVLDPNVTELKKA